MSSILESIATKTLEDELARRKSGESVEKKAYDELMKSVGHAEDGAWLITTEGDEEGRSTKKFGVFAGSFGELALRYGGLSCYSLNLIRPGPDAVPPKPRPVDKVHIQLSSLMPSMLRADTDVEIDACIRAFARWLGPKYTVSKSNYWRSVVVSLSLL